MSKFKVIRNPQILPPPDEIDKAATKAIDALDDLRKLIVNRVPALALACNQLANIIEEFLLKYREEEAQRKKG